MVKTVTNDMLFPALDALEGVEKSVLLRALVPAPEKTKKQIRRLKPILTANFF